MIKKKKWRNLKETEQKEGDEYTVNKNENKELEKKYWKDESMGR